ncbi:MAG: recombinase zinc beta ribbon domain-containing protein, partial [Angelakisella sp.]|nr:recombinase zinc beta ribbon domain-containing protein [Angelakisella sp.]
TATKKNNITGLSCYCSKYALTERLVYGECGTLYKRCTWARDGKKRVVWRCISRLDYGAKYCHDSPTIDEDKLQAAILSAMNQLMIQKELLISQLVDAMQMEMSSGKGDSMSLADIERRIT